MRILLTNDDGILAEGLRALAERLRDIGEVVVVAPEREQSACSRALTLERPIRLRTLGEGRYSVDGTPTDCVLLAVRGAPGILEVHPDLIVSGINHGPNLGDDVTYSGTVAAAAEGCLIGIPSIAVSLGSGETESFLPAANIARSLILQLLARVPTGGTLRDVIPRGTLLNVNVPDLPEDELRGFRITYLGRRIYPDVIAEMRDPRGRPYYWIGGEKASWESDPDSDFAAVEGGYVSVTPLHLDLTHHAMIERLRAWDLALETGRETSEGP